MGKQRALCIGINSYPIQPLSCCIPDATAWAAELKSIDFETTILTDPNRDSIVKGIEALINPSSPGDVLVLHYSGHGMELENPSGGWNEAICPIDFDQGLILSDDDLYELFEKAPDGVNLTCFFDCCHSGHITRLFANESSRPAGAEKARVLEPPLSRQVAGRYRDWRSHHGGSMENFPRSPMREFVFSACQEWQLAWENKNHGIFTEAALTKLRWAYTEKKSYEALRKAICNSMGGEVALSTQWPDLLCGEDWEGATLSGHSFLQPVAVSQRHFLLDGRPTSNRGTSPISAKPSKASNSTLRTSDGFTIDEGRLSRAVSGRSHERQETEPLSRPVRTYTVDPTLLREDGAIATVSLPWEPLFAGPVGEFLRVEIAPRRRSWGAALEHPTLDLDDPRILLEAGRAPSPIDPQFHQQMVYAVCSGVHSAFRSALGRDLAWGFERQNDPGRLRVLPHAGNVANAWYDEERGELCFGWYKAREDAVGRNLPNSKVYLCLSHDAIAHEMTHALIDGLRTDLTVASNSDVLAFHEALADLVALFHRFRYPEVVRAAVKRSRGRLDMADLLTGFAHQLAQTIPTARPGLLALRQAVESDGKRLPLDPKKREPHLRAAPLVAAVYDAYFTVLGRRAEPLIRLATGGTGVLPPGALPADLERLLADAATRTADRFLRICIRAIDYCPPVDLEFGEYLRAMVTADYDLFPEDSLGYREALITSFAQRRIYPLSVEALSEDALRWRAPERPLPAVQDLSFANLRFDGDPARPADEAELIRQAEAVGRFVVKYPECFGLAKPDNQQLRGDIVEPPCVRSVRTARRTGAADRILFDLVVEVTQRRIAQFSKKQTFEFLGGSTLIFGPDGCLRYAIVKNILSEDRLERQRQFIRSDRRTRNPKMRFWEATSDTLKPSGTFLKLCSLPDKAKQTGN